MSLRVLFRPCALQLAPRRCRAMLASKGAIHRASFTTSSRCRAEARAWSCPMPDLVLPDNMDLTQYVLNDLPRYGDKLALVSAETGASVTYAQLHTHVTRVASALCKLGIKHNDVVTIFLPNCPEFAAIFLGITAIGAITSPLNPVYTAGELRHAVKFSESKLLFTTAELLPVAQAACQDCAGFQEIITVGPAEGCRPFSSLLEDDGQAFTENMDISPREQMASLPFSSGTTGLPKGVMLSHYNLVANLQQMLVPSVVRCLSTPGNVPVVLPFFHIYGLVVILLLHLKLGATLTTLRSFEPELFLRSIQDVKANFLHLAPPLVLFLAKHPLVDKYDISSISGVLSAAAPVGQEVCQEVEARLPNLKIRQGYGMTETSPLTHISPEHDIKLASIGRVVPETHCKVVDINTGAMLPPFKEGEICSKGPQVMMGYYNNPEATASTIDPGGWLHSGDIGYVDEEGYFFITDRLKELIKVKGFQVAPAELEAVLVTHPCLTDAAVVAVPDDRAGELPRAFVVKKSGVQCSEEDVAAFVAERVAPYKKLAGGVVFIEQIPKTASGKILRRNLKGK